MNTEDSPTLLDFGVVQSLSCVWLFVAPWIATCQVPLSFGISSYLLGFMPIESMMPSNHLICRCPLLLLPSIFPSIRVFSNESVLRIRWPKYQSFSFSISPSNEYLGLISFRIDWLDLLAVQGVGWWGALWSYCNNAGQTEWYLELEKNWWGAKK